MRLGDVFGRKPERPPAIIGHRKDAEELYADLIREFKHKGAFSREDAEKLYAIRKGLNPQKMSEEEKRAAGKTLRNVINERPGEIREIGQEYAFPKKEETEH